MAAQENTTVATTSTDASQDSSIITNKMMLYDPFELTTNERRKTQCILLGEVNHDIKVILIIVKKPAFSLTLMLTKSWNSMKNSKNL